MRMIRHFCMSAAALLLATLACAPALAGTCTAKQNGNWGSSSTWQGCGTPAAGDDVVIPDPYTVTINGTAAARAVTIGNGGTLRITSDSGTKTFHGLVMVASGGEWNNSADEDVNFRGGLTNNGTFNAGTGVHTFSNNNQSLAGNLSIPNVTVTGVTLTNTGTLTVSSALAGTGGLTNGANATLNIDFGGALGISTLTASATGNLVNYSYDGRRIWGWPIISGDQTIKATTYHHLTLSGRDTKSLANATTVNGNLLISSGVTLDATSSNRALTVGGDFTNNGSFNARSGTVTLNGAAAQTVGGSTATGFYRLIVNNSTSGGSGVILARDVTVNNNLTLTQGIVNTGSNTLILSQACSASWPTGSSASFVAGFARLTFPTGNQTCTFPVGDATTRQYAPITVAFTGSGGGTLTGSTQPDTGNAKQTAAGFNPNASVNRYWTLTKGSLSSFTRYSATLQFNNPGDLDAAASSSDFFVRHYTGGTWITPTLGARTGTSTQATGITQTGFGDFAVGATAASACSPPPGAPPGLTCQCDNFGRAQQRADGTWEINPSPIFGGNWLLNSSSGPAGFPQIKNQGYLRLTDNQSNESNSATVPGIFPAAGNYISVEFRHYAYNGSGADGVGVVLSDSSQPPTPGAFGGSLGFAQKTGINGFNAGWMGVALDEFGNYSNQSEGRTDGPGFFPQSIGIRGSGNGTAGYPWIGGALCTTGYPKSGYATTFSLPASCNTDSGRLDNRGSTTPSRGWSYQIVVDARNYTANNKTTLVSVGRDTAGGSNFTSLVPSFDVYAAKPSQAAVPTNWQITFTGSTGGSTNIHEIGALKVCASTILPPTSVSTAGGFNAIDSVLTGRDKLTVLSGHIYMKVVGAPFKLNVAALANPTTDGLNTVYTSGSGKVELIDDSHDPQSGQSSCNATAAACSACSRPVVATQNNFTFSSADKGFKSTADFTLDKPYKRLIARITQTSGGKTTVGCSVDGFAVRPAYYALSSVNTKTRAGPFVINAAMKQVNGTTVTGSSGAPTMTPEVVPNLSLISWPAGGLAGDFFYDDVGTINLPKDAIYDAQFGNAAGEARDQDAGDCNPGSVSDSVYTPNTCYGYSGGACNVAVSKTPDSAGKYGCDIGGSALSAGPFYPDHYEASVTMVPACGTGGFTYMGQPFSMTDADGGRIRIKALASGKTFADDALPSYTGSGSTFAKVWFGARNGAGSTTDLIGRITYDDPPKTLPDKAAASSTWVNGIYTAPASTFTFSRPTSATPDGTWGSYDSLDIGVTVSDPDGSALAIPVGHDFTLNGDTYQAISGNAATRMRLGRMRIDNAYGSTLLDLPVKVAATYWNGSRYAINALDSCTSTEGFALSGWSGMASNSTSMTGSGELSGGTGSLILTRPSPAPAGKGSVMLNSNLTPYLPGAGRQTFGVYKSRFIYLREMY